MPYFMVLNHSELVLYHAFLFCLTMSLCEGSLTHISTCSFLHPQCRDIDSQSSTHTQTWFCHCVCFTVLQESEVYSRKRHSFTCVDWPEIRQLKINYYVVVHYILVLHTTPWHRLFVCSTCNLV